MPWHDRTLPCLVPPVRADSVAAVWIALALLAGLLQVARNAASRALGRDVPHLLNTWARFTFNLPFTGVLLLVVTGTHGWPILSPTFWAWTAACAFCQSAANLCLVAAFAAIPFARAVVLHKTEVALAPFVGVLLFAELPTLCGWLGVLLCALGTMALNVAGRPEARWRDLWRFDRGSLCALGSAVGVVFASFFLKRGCAVFEQDNPALPDRTFLAAVHALVHAAWLQSVVLTFLLWRWRRADFALVRPHWRGMLRLGLAAAVCSLCWFQAYALALVAYVKALGQIEIVAAALWSRWVIGERGLRAQLPAIALVVLGILVVLLGQFG